MQTQFYKNICTTERVWHEYFRVGFYGRGFGELQNKEFIYKGNVFERLEDFGERLKRRWTNAEFLNYTDPPTPDVINSDKQCILFLTKTHCVSFQFSIDRLVMNVKENVEIVSFIHC
jgi:hypothetical protein